MLDHFLYERMRYISITVEIGSFHGFEDDGA
jgi:hypothetical protein